MFLDISVFIPSYSWKVFLDLLEVEEIGTLLHYSHHFLYLHFFILLALLLFGQHLVKYFLLVPVILLQTFVDILDVAVWESLLHFESHAVPFHDQVLLSFLFLQVLLLLDRNMLHKLSIHQFDVILFFLMPHPFDFKFRQVSSLLSLGVIQLRFNRAARHVLFFVF